MKVVLDTNVLISALISPHNPLTSSFNHGSPETLSFSPQRISSKKFGESRVMPICSPFCNSHRVGVLVNRMRSLATIVRPESLISEEALDP